MVGLSQKSRILVVEDNADIRGVVVVLLEDLGFAVETAADGQQALARLRSSQERPSIVLLDLMMPIMTGWQLLEEMQADDSLSQIPVVVTSAIVEGFPTASNVVSCLTKPIIFDQLLEAIENHQPQKPPGIEGGGRAMRRLASATAATPGKPWPRLSPTGKGANEGWLKF